MTSGEITLLEIALDKKRNRVSYLVSLYTLDAGSILIESIMIMYRLNLMAWKASLAHRRDEMEKKIMILKIKKSVQTSSACG